MVPVLHLIIHYKPCSLTCLRYTLILYHPLQSFPSGLSPLGFPAKGHLPLVQCVLHPCLLHWFDWYVVWRTEQFMGFARLYGRIVRFVADLLQRKFVLDLWPLGMGFVVDEVVLGLIFLRLFRFCLFISISPLLHIRNSLTYQRRNLSSWQHRWKTNFSLPVSLQPSLLQPFCQKSSQALYVPYIETWIFASMFNKGRILICFLLGDKKTNWTEC
jgi:hypothetical protein